MSVRTEIKGNRYGKWVALGVYEYRRQPNWRNVCYELCACDCGTVRFVKRSSLIEWKSRWCECFYKDGWYRNLLAERNKWQWLKHWLSWDVLYRKYTAILTRCYNKNCKAYKNYGGRGIRCEWKSFEEFLNDMYESYLEHCEKYWKRNTTIERINNNWNYCKENCKWATMREQNRNKRTSRKVKYYWEIYDLLDLCEINWVDYFMVWKRLEKWWDLEMAIWLPKVRNKNLFRK